MGELIKVGLKSIIGMSNTPIEYGRRPPLRHCATEVFAVFRAPGIVCFLP